MYVMHREALELNEKVLGREHPFTLTHYSQGKYEEAEQMHREALELREKVLGREHPDTLISRTNLALVLKAREPVLDSRQHK